MSKFKLTQTATEVQNILNNSLQKPTGLSKTELVGVGVNGQENIEIGDNLTLANGKLSSATGGLPSTIKFDAEGNRTASKDVKVDGKLKLKSLVSASNPDGDITKELGGGGGGSITLYCHNIQFVKIGKGFICFDFYSSNSTTYTYDTLVVAMNGKQFSCSGSIDPYNKVVYVEGNDNKIIAWGVNSSYAISSIDNLNEFKLYDVVSPVN